MLPMRKEKIQKLQLRERERERVERKDPPKIKIFSFILMYQSSDACISIHIHITRYIRVKIWKNISDGYNKKCCKVMTHQSLNT